MFSLATRALRAVPRAKPIRAFASTSVSRAPPQSTPVDELIVAIDETQDRIQDEQPQNPEGIFPCFNQVGRNSLLLHSKLKALGPVSDAPGAHVQSKQYTVCHEFC